MLFAVLLFSCYMSKALQYYHGIVRPVSRTVDCTIAGEFLSV